MKHSNETTQQYNVCNNYVLTKQPENETITMPQRIVTRTTQQQLKTSMYLQFKISRCYPHTKNKQR